MLWFILAIVVIVLIIAIYISIIEDNEENEQSLDNATEIEESESSDDNMMARHSEENIAVEKEKVQNLDDMSEIEESEVSQNFFNNSKNKFMLGLLGIYVLVILTNIYIINIEPELLYLFGIVDVLVVWYTIYKLREKSNINKINQIIYERGFNVSRKISYCDLYQVFIDTENEEIAVAISSTSKVTFLKFSKIIECRITENSNVISKGGVGRAIVGGLLAGGIGAVIGANTRKSKNMINTFSVDIITNDINNSVVSLNMVNSPIDISNNPSTYKNLSRFAGDVYSAIQAIVNKNNEKIEVKAEEKQMSNDDLEQLEKLSELKEKGIITQEEFEESKKKILSKL